MYGSCVETRRPQGEVWVHPRVPGAFGGGIVYDQVESWLSEF